jgi:hypothetical protein
MARFPVDAEFHGHVYSSVLDRPEGGVSVHRFDPENYSKALRSLWSEEPQKVVSDVFGCEVSGELIDLGLDFIEYRFETERGFLSYHREFEIESSQERHVFDLKDFEKDYRSEYKKALREEYGDYIEETSSDRLVFWDDGPEPSFNL